MFFEVQGDSILLQENVPEYIYHYTSMDVLKCLLTNVKEERGGLLIFHATSIFFMNDKKEYEQIRENLEDEDFLEEVRQTMLVGEPFLISFTKSQVDTVPMWKMYADDGKGVCLKFRTEEIISFLTQEYHDKDNSYFLYHSCIDSKKSKKLFKGIESIKRTKLLRELAFYKHESFLYEDEYRFAFFEMRLDDIKFKTVDGSIFQYIEVAIPLYALDEVVVGPRADYELTEHVLKNLRGQLSPSYFNICKSGTSLK